MAPLRGMRGLSTRVKGAIVSALVVVVLVVLLMAATSSHSKPRAALFIFAGQSNMVGFGSLGSTPLPVSLRTPRNDALFWDRAKQAWSNMPITPAGEYGPEVSALRHLADRLHRPVLGVKVAENATSLAKDWEPARPDGFYAQMRSTVSDALLSRVKGQDAPEVAGFFWMQGEADAQQLESAQNYGGNLGRLISQVRTDFSADRLPFVLGRIRVNNPVTETGSNLVRAAEDRAATSIQSVASVSTDDLSRWADQLHFDGRALVTLGTRFADAYMKLKR